MTELNSSPKHSPKNMLKLTKLTSTNNGNQDSLMKSLAVSLASRVSGSINESFIGGSKLQQTDGGNNNGGGYTDRIQNLSDKITNQITDLDNKLDSILEKHEKDFLTAYRYHMLKVQKELVSLKSKANENELKNQQESRINELEKQTQTFREQCMKIRTKCDQQEKTLENLKNQIDELEDDRKFLDYEIRDSRLQNKMLKITLSKQHNECEEISQLNQTAKDDITFIQNQTIINKTMTIHKNYNQFDSTQQASPYQTQQQKNNNLQSSYLQQSYMDKQTTEMTTARPNNIHGVTDVSQTQNNMIKNSPYNFKNELGNQIVGSVQEEDYEDTLIPRQNAQQQQQQQQNQQVTQNNLYATFMKDSQQSRRDGQQDMTQNPLQYQTSNLQSQNYDDAHLDAEETQYDQRTNSNQLQFQQDQDSNDLLQDDLNNDNNLPIQDTYNDINNATGNQQAKLKYMSKISQGYKEGRGPGDLKKTFMYNAKFTQQLFDVLELTNKNVAPTAQMVEQMFQEDSLRRQQVVEQLQQQLEHQRKLNAQKQQQIQLQKQLVSQKKESEVLVQTFKNCINAVIMDKKDRLNITQLSKDSLYGSDKKRIMELFVENDNTLSHLLEFISSKLINDDSNVSQKSETSSKKGPSRQQGTQSNSVQRPINSGQQLLTRQIVDNSQLSGTGQIQNDQLPNINKQSSTINHYNLHIPIKSLSSDIKSSQYYSQQNPQSKLLNIVQANSSMMGQQNQNHYNNTTTTQSNLNNYQAIALKNINDPLIGNSQNNSTMRGEPSPYNIGNGNTGNINNFNSKTTLRLAGQASITKSSHQSLGNVSSKRNQSQILIKPE